jgi:hypothetical protein
MAAFQLDTLGRAPQVAGSSGSVGESLGARNLFERHDLGNRLIRWFTFTIVFALVPLGTSVLLRHLEGEPMGETLRTSPELLFFSLMVCATALGDLTEAMVKGAADLLLRGLFSALLVGAVASAILYGSFIYSSVSTTGAATFRSNLAQISALLAVVFGLLGTAVQVLLGRIERAA